MPMRVGIEDLTEYTKEAHLIPDNFEDPNELSEALESANSWLEEGQYVFWWDQDYYIGSEGTVEAS